MRAPGKILVFCRESQPGSDGTSPGAKNLKSSGLDIFSDVRANVNIAKNKMRVTWTKVLTSQEGIVSSRAEKS